MTIDVTGADLNWINHGDEPVQTVDVVFVGATSPPGFLVFGKNPIVFKTVSFTKFIEPFDQVFFSFIPVNQMTFFENLCLFLNECHFFQMLLYPIRL